jgi:hypothetical protein
MSKSGGCLCGAVRYEASGDPVFAGHCYCTDCRKTSSSHTSVSAYPMSAVKLTGEIREFTGKGDSGMPVTRAFCPTCGTQLYSKGDSNAGLMLLKAGTFDDVEAFRPMASIYTSRAPSWDRPPADIPAFPETPPRG